MRRRLIGAGTTMRCTVRMPHFTIEAKSVAPL
jgi:hypothetical protein